MICLNCQQKTLNPKFCSKSCSASYTNKIKPKRKVEGICVHCKKSIPSRKSFCSKNCLILLKLEKSKFKCCSMCKINFKNTTENFYKRGKENILQSYCKKCYNKKTSERQREAKKYMVKKLGEKCIICGYDKCLSSLTFHHLDAAEKEYSLSSGKLFNKNKIDKELEKCILACRNCHGEIHAGLHPQYLI